jgi:dolichol kinase
MSPPATDCSTTSDSSVEGAEGNLPPVSVRALALEAKPLLLSLHAILRELEAKKWQVEFWESLKPRLEALEASARELIAKLEVPSESELGKHLLELAAAIRSAIPGVGCTAEELRAEWATYQERFQAAYDHLCASMKALSVAAPERRPENVARSVLHVFTATTCALLVVYVLSPTWMMIVAGIGVAACWAMEIGRVFSPRLNDFLCTAMALARHPHETRDVNSATWYTTALLILAVCFSPAVCVLALAILGLADPAAALVGRRWGRIRLIHGRSLEGSATFFVAGALAGVGVLSLWYPEISLGARVAMAAGAALFGAVAELLSSRVDDNLSIPVAAGTGGWLVTLLLAA